MNRWIGSVLMLVGLTCSCHAITALDKTTNGSPEQRTAFFKLGLSLLVLSVPSNFFFGEWRRSGRSSSPGDAREGGDQAGRGLASISLFRGVLLCLSGIGIWSLAYAARHPGRDADAVWIWANLAFALLTVLVPLFGFAGFYFGLVGLFQSRQWRSVAITGLILNGTVVLPVVLFALTFLGLVHFWIFK